MAVQVDVERSSALGRPHLDVFDPVRQLDPSDSRFQALRRRRLARRARQAAEAGVWLAGTAGLIIVVLGGLAGLR